MKPTKGSVELSLLVVLGVFLVNAQPGEKCSTRIAELYPRQMLDLDQMVGEWMGIQMAWRDSSLVTPQWAKCASQFFSRQNDSINLNIILKYDLTTTGKHVERVGQIDIGEHPSHSHWRKWFYEDPSRWWEEVVIATDYKNYWIQYECEINNDGIRVETVVMRARTRTITQTEKEIYESIVEGLGFPPANFVGVPQPINCGHANSTTGKVEAKKPLWWTPDFY